MKNTVRLKLNINLTPQQKRAIWKHQEALNKLDSKTQDDEFSVWLASLVRILKEK